MIVLQGAIPDICKKCKKTGGLEDGLYLIHTEEDFVNFYCDGQSWKTCPIKGEIPDEHGRLIDGDKLERRIKYVSCDNCHPQSKDDCRGCGIRNIVDEVKSMTTIVEATEDFAKELEKYDEKVALNRERKIEDVGAN